ncbi:MAG: ABC transporter permease, partial [Acidobacteria bacterium]|nr:ABC transporter permease [Acidobacteriota bacterium]
METFRIAAEALRRHALRSFLTLLGVIIGVMTIVAVVSVISGINNFIATEVFTLSPDVFIATQFGIITSQEEFFEAVKRKPIDMDDLRAVREHCKTCGVVSAQSGGRMDVRRNGKELEGVQVFAGTSNLAITKNVDIDAGRFFTASEDRHGAAVAVIGTDLRDELFGRVDPLGRTFKLQGRNLTVIGVLKKQGSLLGQNQDNQMYVPLTMFSKSFGTRRSIGIGIRPTKGIGGMNECMDEVRVILRSRRHTGFQAKDPFSFVTAEALQAVWKSISASSFALLTFISGISLVVGGIVITNIMLVSVV